MSIEIYEHDGLIRADDLSAAGDETRYLRVAAERGELVRIRRGVYCRAEIWGIADSWQRHRLHIRAALITLGGELVVGGRSAATMWELPGAARWPEPVMLYRPDAAGWSSPGVRFTRGAPEPVSVDGIACAGIARTALDVARISGLADGVAVLDAVQDRRRPSRVTRPVLEAELRSSTSPRGVARARRALDFSSDSSESVGESHTRVAIHRLGYPAPELQREFRDAQGSMFVDFYWEHLDLAVEFDGKVKYTRNEFTGGDPSEVVWREKKREDRLRRLVARVDRVITAEVERPSRLDAILSAQGLSRRPGARRNRA